MKQSSYFRETLLAQDHSAWSALIRDAANSNGEAAPGEWYHKFVTKASKHGHIWLVSDGDHPSSYLYMWRRSPWVVCAGITNGINHVSNNGPV